MKRPYTDIYVMEAEAYSYSQIVNYFHCISYFLARECFFQESVLFL